MKESTRKLGFGILLILISVILTSMPVYTSIKGMVVDASGSIVLAIAVAWGLMALGFGSGIMMLKQAK